MAEPVTTYLCLGGNLGDRMAALTDALRLLDATPGMRCTACSSVYETEPWGVSNQPSFLNLVAAYETTLSPVDLLAACKTVEETVGRVASYRWGPRLIDVDILLYGSKVVDSVEPDLQVPHPRMAQRAFALVPLAEIAPHAIVPPQGDTVRLLLDEVDGKDGVARWGALPDR
ncbi:MAG: 2-amino-4-hydroxy-6-hydroxymethyldihydropteridine diphosphokinase [Chloroflexota bacterium]|nr:2-amino-4-hydroxy-6-hydroxymethyldihydropteridine diphosphokinase [Chloroflexota bacterium]MDE2959883.1 2-amino-4-hydroxy-6-hydroxymethyldihydropteridine diphosphokinase [Chloroflexota bacterium]